MLKLLIHNALCVFNSVYVLVSIGRRLQDPLAELVKIEPKHLGIGMYQVSEMSIKTQITVLNRPFPNSPVPPFQNESKCETFRMKMSKASSFLFMQIIVIFIRMVLHLDSL